MQGNTDYLGHDVESFDIDTSGIQLGIRHIAATATSNASHNTNQTFPVARTCYARTCYNEATRNLRARP